MDTTGTNYFVLYIEVSLGQGLVIDHTLLIVANYNKQDWMMKKIVLIRDLHSWALLQLMVADTYRFLMEGVANYPLYAVIHYCPGSNGTKVSVRYTE